MSSLDAMQRTPSFQAILDIGDPAVPELMQALRDSRAVIPVMMLLHGITGETPVVAPDKVGKTDEMVAAWLERGNGL